MSALLNFKRRLRKLDSYRGLDYAQHVNWCICESLVVTGEDIANYLHLSNKLLPLEIYAILGNCLVINYSIFGFYISVSGITFFKKYPGNPNDYLLRGVQVSELINYFHENPDLTKYA